MSEHNGEHSGETGGGNGHGAGRGIGALRRFGNDIWSRDAAGDPMLLRKLKSVFRWVYLVFHGFFSDQILIRASALTFTTILSIVPFIAVAFSISKGFGLQNADFIRDMLMKVTAGREEITEKILEYIANTNVKTLGWVGVATLLLTVFSMVGTVEKAFNTIWGVTRGRSAWRKFTDFFSVILVVPVILILASGFTVTMQKHEVVQRILSVSGFSMVEAMMLKLAPLVLIWMAFLFAYVFIPNTRVKFTSALVGGMVGGTLWQVAQWFYINWQIGVQKYNAIYGSFAQLPLFLMWLYISWVIVLFGAEAAYATQHLNVFIKERFFGDASLRERRKLAVLLFLFLTKRFEAGTPPATVDQVAASLQVPVELVSDLFVTLRDAGYVVLAETEEGEAYAPAVSPDTVRFTDVMDAITDEGKSLGEELIPDEFGFVDETIAAIEQSARDSGANHTFGAYADKLGD